MNANIKKVIVAGGGTGGHLFPAIAIGEELESDGILVKHIGSRNGIESNGKFIDKDKIELLDLKGISRGYSIQSIINNIQLIFKIMKSYIKVKKIIKNFKPDLVIGTGGYSCAIPLYIALKENINTAIQEQNVLPGMVTQKLANKVKIIFISFNETKNYLKNDNCYLTGNPIRKQIKKIDPIKSKDRFNLDLEKFTILIIGGSQGARSINIHFKENYKQYIDMNIQLIWQTGNQSADIVDEINNSNIRKIDFIDDIENAYSASDLIVSRAGATAISEILYLGKPSILIPYPHASENHQELNAEALDSKGLAIMVKEEELTNGVLENKLFKLISSKNKIKKMEVNALNFSNSNASKLIKQKIEEIILC